jgi:trehalose 6-phosphate phosphatase
VIVFVFDHYDISQFVAVDVACGEITVGAFFYLCFITEFLFKPIPICFGPRRDNNAELFTVKQQDIVRTAAGKVPEARVEDKGASIAVHYRQAPDPQAARVDLVVALQPIASQCGLELVEGKMVLELVPSGRPMKGGVVERLVGEHGLEAILFAGDDRADLDAFEALDRLSGSGVTVIRVAVRGEETPQALIDAADVTVEGPSGLVQFLRSL